EHVERVELVLHSKSKKPTGSVVDRYRYPPQEMEIRRGGELKTRDGNAFGTVTGVDRVERTIDIRKGPSRASIHPISVFQHRYVRPDVLESAIIAVAESAGEVVDVSRVNPVARALLMAEPPRLSSGTFLSPDDATAASY